MKALLVLCACCVAYVNGFDVPPPSKKWHAVMADVDDGDGLLNLTELTAAFAIFTQADSTIQYAHLDRLLVIGDEDHDKRLSHREVVMGTHTLRHLPTAGAGSACPTSCYECGPNSKHGLTFVSKEYCEATPGVDFWRALGNIIVNQSGGGGPMAQAVTQSLFVVVALLWLLPALVVFCLLPLYRRVCRGGSGGGGKAMAMAGGGDTAAGASSSHTRRSITSNALSTEAKLEAAARQAARLRRRVSGSLMQLGWMLFVLGLCPWLVSIISGYQQALNQTIGSYMYYLSAMVSPPTAVAAHSRADFWGGSVSDRCGIVSDRCGIVSDRGTLIDPRVPAAGGGDCPCCCCCR